MTNHCRRHPLNKHIFHVFGMQQFKKLAFTDVLTVELNQRDDGREIQAIMGEMTGATTVHITHHCNSTTFFLSNLPYNSVTGAACFC